jgi:MFS family permease
MFTYVTFHLAAPPFSLSTVALGWLFVVYLVGIVITPFGGRWIDRYGHRTGLALAMALGAAGALLTLTPWLVVIAAGLALCSSGVFIAQAATSSYIGAVTTRDRALAVGLYSTFYYAGGTSGRERRRRWVERRLAGVCGADCRGAMCGRGDFVDTVVVGQRRA